MQSATHTASDPEGPIPLFTEISNHHSLPKEKQNYYAGLVIKII